MLLAWRRFQDRAEGRRDGRASVGQVVPARADRQIAGGGELSIPHDVGPPPQPGAVEPLAVELEDDPLRRPQAVDDDRPTLQLDQGLRPRTRQALRDMGYRLESDDRTSGPINAIFFDWQNNAFWGGSSNYGEDYGIGW